MAVSGTPPQDAFDQLADMFLSDDEREPRDVIARVKGGVAQPSRPRESEHRDRESNRPRGSAVNGLRFADPAPTDPASASASESVARADAVSFIYAGHLPVKAGLWLPNAAMVLAEQSAGPIGLVRARTLDECSVEVFSPVGNGEVRLIEQARDQAQSHTLEEVRNAFSRMVPSYLVEIGSLDALAQLNTHAHHRVILLSAADPVSIAGLYRTIKRASEVLTSLPDIALIMVGSRGEKAEEAIRRLAGAVRSFLDHELKIVGVMPEIRPVRSVHVGLFPFSSLADSVVSLTGESRKTDQRTQRRASSWRQQRKAETAGSGPRSPETEAANEPTINAVDLSDSGAKCAERSIRTQPIAQAQTDRSLALFVANLRDLGVRCPKAEHVEIAVDDKGFIHTLVCDAPTDPVKSTSPTNTQDDQSVGELTGERVVEALMAVSEWISEHADILAALRSAPPALTDRIRAEGRAVAVRAHVFTSQPMRYRKFLDGRMRVHMVARPNVESSSTGADAQSTDWIHVPIS